MIQSCQYFLDFDCAADYSYYQFFSQMRVTLKGSCAVCGHEVDRVVETSESDHSKN
jgi:hypothetical protein